jgi:hypothetical protein
MVPHDEKDMYTICDCPAGEAKREYLNKSPEERRRERKAAERKRKDEPERSWVKE